MATKTAAAKRTRSTGAKTRKRAASRSAKASAAKKAERRAVSVQRPLWIAVGAVALASDALQSFFKDALKRGEKLEAQARKEFEKRTNGKAKEPVESVAKEVRKRARKSPLAELEPSKVADRVLHALEIPTHHDILELEKKVDRLSRKVA